MTNGSVMNTSDIFNAIANASKLNIHFNNLTKIVVIGDQSSGKSSLVESLCGASILPKKEGLASRKPVDITLVNGPTKQFFVNDEEFSTELDTMNKINKLNNTNMTKIINVKIISPDVYNMSFIDTPGLTKMDQDGMNPKKIKRMIVKYMDDPNNIFIIVSSAATDPANCQALQLAHKHKRVKDCIGVFTKMDLVENQGNQNIYEILSGNRFPLGYGWGCVRLRNDAEILSAVTIDDCIRTECSYFAHIKLPTTFIAGIPKVRSRVSKVQLERITNDFGRIISEIDSKIAALHNSKTFIEKVISDPHRTLVDKVINIFKRLVESSIERAQLDSSIKTEIHKALIGYMNDIYDYKQDSKIKPRDTTEPINEHIYQYHCANSTKSENLVSHDLQNIFGNTNLYQVTLETEFRRAYKNETDLAMMLGVFHFNAKVDPSEKKKWREYIERYSTTLQNDNTLQDLIYNITEKLIIEHITSSNITDDVTIKFAEFLVRDIGSKSYESNIKYSINNLIKLEELPHINIMELVRELVQIIEPSELEFYKGWLGRYNLTKKQIDLYGEDFNKAYLRSVINNLAVNCYRIVEVNLINKMMVEILTSVLSLNKESAHRENDEIVSKIQALMQLKSTLIKYKNANCLTDQCAEFVPDISSLNTSSSSSSSSNSSSTPPEIAEDQYVEPRYEYFGEYQDQPYGGQQYNSVDYSVN